MTYTERHKLYSTARWKKLRACILAEQPVCRMCNEAISTVVDHIKPHKGDIELFLDPDNLQGLCKRCHDSDKAIIEAGGVPRRAVGVDGWAVDENAFRSPQEAL